MSALVRELWDALLRPSGAHGLDLADVAATGYYVRLLVLLDHQVRVSGGGSTLFVSYRQEVAQCGARRHTIERWLNTLSQAGLIRYGVTPRGVEIELLAVNNRPIESTETGASPRPDVRASASPGMRVRPDVRASASRCTHDTLHPSRARAEVLTTKTNTKDYSRLVADAPDPASESCQTKPVGKAGKGEDLVTDDDLIPIYALYPRKGDRGRGFKVLHRQKLKPADLPALKLAVENYAASVAGKDAEFIRLWATFAANWRDWVEVEKKAASIVLIDMDAVYGKVGAS